ncbi:MAG: hypothetical protein M1814_002235 [Vezdaea aestivalis]|nr:MAG: hypothetical protein M1814_002235 [Vezdaea aestivalis]
MFDPSLFAELQAKIDQEAKVKEELRIVLHNLERQTRKTHSILAKAHSIPSRDFGSPTEGPLGDTGSSFSQEVKFVIELKNIAGRYPYYKYNSLWSRNVQDSAFSALYYGWLGGFEEFEAGTVLPIEAVGTALQVPVNIKHEDAFHLTIEEYLQALISLIEELARLAVNSVTLGDYKRPGEIGKLLKNIQAGFQLLNLKNDSLRRRSDSIKYNVKKVEDVVYDLSLRNLVPKE